MTSNISIFFFNFFIYLLFFCSKELGSLGLTFSPFLSSSTSRFKSTSLKDPNTVETHYVSSIFIISMVLIWENMVEAWWGELLKNSSIPWIYPPLHSLASNFPIMILVILLCIANSSKFDGIISFFVRIGSFHWTGLFNSLNYRV